MSNKNSLLAKSDSSKLFSIVGTELSRYWAQVRGQAERGVLLFPASEGDKLGQVLFGNLKRGGSSTLLVTGRSPWDPDSHYYRSSRLAAQKGCHIVRLFLLPHRHCRHDTSLRRHLELDRAANIETEVLYVGDLLSSLNLPMTASLEMGLWDDEVICVALHGSYGSAPTPTEWRVSCRPEDLQLQTSLFNTLRTDGTTINIDEPGQQLELEEPMLTTAPLVSTLASVLCRGDHVSPDDCSWYHSVWQYLRIFDMVSTPTWHSNFYLTELSNLARSGSFTNVLISGAADYSMLAHVLWAYDTVQADIQSTVLDLCETPLFLCKWYAKLVEHRIETIAADLLTFRRENAYDVVTTDAFLTRFPPAERYSVIESWYKLLRPGGKVVTTIRIEPGVSSEIVRATPSQVENFRRRALQEARRWQGFLGLAPEDIANQAKRYAEEIVSYSFRSEREVQELFEGQGFRIDRHLTNEVPGEMSSTSYCELVAHKTTI